MAAAPLAAPVPECVLIKPLSKHTQKRSPHNKTVSLKSLPWSPCVQPNASSPSLRWRFYDVILVTALRRLLLRGDAPRPRPVVRVVHTQPTEIYLEFFFSPFNLLLSCVKRTRAAIKYFCQIKSPRLKAARGRGPLPHGG